MKSYLTEESVWTAERTYLKGQFTGKYHASRNEASGTGYAEYFDMHIYMADVAIDEVRKEDLGDFPRTTALPLFKGAFVQPVNCFDPKSGTHFKLTLEEVKIDQPVLSLINRESTEHLGTISGTLYGYITKKIETKITKEHWVDDSPFSRTSATNQVAHNKSAKRTLQHEFSFIGGIRHRRDQYRNTNGFYYWGNWYPMNGSWSFGSVIAFIFGLFYIGLLLISLISLSWPGLIILGVLLLLFFIGRVRTGRLSGNFFSLFLALMFLLYFGGLAISAYRHQATNRAIAATTIKPDPRDYARSQPVKQKTVNTGGPTPENDEWIVHHREWTDLSGNRYEGDVRVLRSDYQKAQARYGNLQHISGLPDVYRSMSLGDQNMLRGVYSLFDSLKTAGRLDSAGFAAMLVSFVQDIPYSTVTDVACDGGQGGALSQQAIPTATSCVGNIPYGVQSPVEFMANFRGDCDTRTLFLFTLLNHYHYKVAILGSDAFRHSLLGIALPIPGTAKTAGQDRYVLWETTSRGFPPGQINPEIDQLDYWNFYLINQPTS